MDPPPPLDSADVVSVPETPADTSNDPPPPYPSHSRRVRRQRRANVQGIQTSHHQQNTSPDSSEYDPLTSPSHLNNSEHDENVQVSPIRRHVIEERTYPHDSSESTPLLSPVSRTQNSHRASTTRHRSGSISHASILSSISQSPSLAQTVRSLFQTEYDSDYDEEGDPTALRSRGSEHEGYTRLDCASPAAQPPTEPRRTIRRFSAAGLKKYFRPLAKKPYYMSLFHLMVVNFPYALAAWVYLFVFTLTGTALLMALPLGAVLCFFNLIGARAFARGELYLQTKFHSPLPYPPPYPPRPIFTRLRLRAPTASEIEAGHSHPRNSEEFEPETSFYKNTYAMFTDPTSYQALFYFLVIKPAITLTFTLLLIVLVIPAMVLVVTAPPALRAVRRLGVWQAGVAVEGLYLAVR